MSIKRGIHEKNIVLPDFNQVVANLLRFCATCVFSAFLAHSGHVFANDAYVVNTNDHTVSVIDTTTDLVTATISVGNGPQGVAINPELLVTSGFNQ